METIRIDGNSTENQEIKRKFVEREVLACFSYEMEAVLRASSEGKQNKDYPLPTYDDVENCYEYKCPDCGDTVEQKNEQFECCSCEWKSDDAPDQEPQEIFEWWIISNFLYDHLKSAVILFWIGGIINTGDAVPPGKLYYWME